MSLRVYYFGCWGVMGHCLYTPSAVHAWKDERNLPWPHIDGVLAPGRRDDYQRVPFERQIQGHAALHHKDGWTAMAFWDRSFDTRGGANSAFIAEGTHDFARMVFLAMEHFPDVWKRITTAFPIVLAAGP